MTHLTYPYGSCLKALRLGAQEGKKIMVYKIVANLFVSAGQKMYRILNC